MEYGYIIKDGRVVFIMHGKTAVWYDGDGTRHESPVDFVSAKSPYDAMSKISLKLIEKGYEVKAVSPDIEKWSGCATFTQEEIDCDPRLKAILSK